jgi:hypothetical protein
MNDEHKRIGRPPGSPNKFTSELRQAMLEGALLSDDAKDPNNKDAPASLTQYMRNIANKYPVAYFKALTRLIPQEIRTQSISDSTVEIAFHSISDVKVALLESGLTPKQVRQLEAMLPVIEPANIEPVDDDDAVDIFDRDSKNDSNDATNTL